jgi:VWFA-related protein
MKSGIAFSDGRVVRSRMTNGFVNRRFNCRGCGARWVRPAVFLFLTAFCAVARGQQQTEPPPQSQPPSQQQPAPQPQPQQTGQPRITSEVKAVSVLASVRDKHGKVIADLKKENFALAEDGRPQTITYFAHESDLPLRLGLLVDTSMSQRRVLEQERTASYGFLDDLIRADKDLAFVIHFDREVELLEDFTSARSKLLAALQSLQTPQYDSGGGGSSGGGGGRGSHHGGGGGGTLLYDAIYLASNELMSKQHGRKALIILTDGVDHGSKESLTTAIESAQRADTVVYSILFKDDEGYGNRSGGMMGPRGGGHHGGGGGGYPREEHPDGKKILERLSKETGGQLFEVTKKETVDKIYADIEEELRSQYSLGYTPDKSTGAGYHKIQLTTNQKDLIVQARDGYYSAQ